MSERITGFGKTHSMELIVFPLFVLILIGIISNNMIASNVQTMPTFQISSYSLGVVTPIGNNGCDSSKQNCNFTVASAYTFLNPNSPFTLLVQGNILSFIVNIFTMSESPNIFYSAYSLCYSIENGVFQNESNIDIHGFVCQGYTANGAGTHPFPNAGVPINFTSNDGNNSIWQGFGCKLVNGNYPCSFTNLHNTAQWTGNATFVSFWGLYLKNGTTIQQSATCSIGQTIISLGGCNILMPFLFHSSSVFTCQSQKGLREMGINTTTTFSFCLIPAINPATSASSLPNSFSAISFITGALLLFLGIGLAITSAVIGFSINAQGTKLAQVFGFGLIVWSFIYGEFGSWLSVFTLGIGTIVFVMFTASFFLGLYWRMFSLD